MKKFYLLFFVLFVSLTGAVKSQNVLVSGALVGNGLYPDMGSAFTAINGGAQTGANILITIIGNTAEPVSAVLNQGDWAFVYISPGGGAARTIAGSVAGPLISLNSADRVVFDGLNTGGNSLTIENTSTGAASTIRFVNDARANAVQNLSLLGASSSATMGTVHIDLGTGSGGGNDSLLFDNVNISNSGAAFPLNAIYSAGTTTAGQENSQIQFNNCRVSNFFSASAISRGFFVSTGNTEWVITNCRIFQTATRNYTTGNTHFGIRVASGENHLISGNIIGYATDVSTGIYTMTGTIATRFVGIDLNVAAGLPTSVQGNTFTAISLATSSGAATTYGILCGISANAGNVIIGNVAPNIIGGPIGVGLLSATPTTAQGTIVGIHSSSVNTILIQNNVIGAIASTGTTAAVSGGVMGISVSGAAANMTITGNTIGNPTADNMRAGTLGLTTGSSIASGINLASMPLICNVTNNTITNLSSYGTATAGYVRGIWTGSGTGSVAVPAFSNNTITKLVTNSTLATYTNGQTSALGICVGIGNNVVVNGNTINDIRNIGATTAGAIVAGITHANATNSIISNNVINNMGNGSTSVTTTAPGVVAGIVVRSGTTNTTVYNNMISLGTGETTNTAFIGIVGNHGSTPDPTVRVYHNTINIEGVATSGAQPSFGIARTDFSATARTAPVDIRNNIVTNTRSGGTGQHFAIANNYGATATATGWGANASNNNVLNANAATVGWWTSVRTFAGWKTVANCDPNSFSGVTVTYVNNATDLHLNFGVTPTVIESSGQPIALVTTDIDGQARPGPSGSVNGGAFAPDLGADEIDGVADDQSAPIITYTLLPFTCSTGDRVLTATIADLTGVPTTGGLMPRVYFRKNVDPWFSNAGSLASGTGNNGTWNFTISAGAMGGLAVGDVVGYYVIAQDLVAIPNLTSNPSAGLVAADVNTVTTPPTTPNTYSINTLLSGTYTVGAAGAYPTLTAAVNAYNTGCIGGPVVFSLTDATYPSETFPITVLGNPYASSVNTLTIKPATGMTPLISGNNASAILRLNGADFVTIDGSNTVNGTTKDLTINNTNTGASSTIWINCPNANDAASNNTVKNCNVNGNATTTALAAIITSGSALGGVAETANFNNRFENNTLQRAQYGLGVVGPGTMETGTVISGNIVGSSTASNKIGFRGIFISNQQDVLCADNQVFGVTTSTTSDPSGIIVVGASSGGSIVRNKIWDIKNTNTGGYGSFGIFLTPSTTASNLTVANNFISDVTGYGYTGIALSDNGYGIAVNSGGGFNIWHNTVLMNTNQTTATYQTAAIWIAPAITTPGALNIRNNIFTSTQTTGTQRYAIYCGATNNNIFSSIDNNDYKTAGANMAMFNVTNYNTLGGIQTAFGGNTNSVSISPVFVGAPDLHLVPASNAALNNLGVFIAGVPADIDMDFRTATPDLGADEMSCVTAVAGTVASSVVFCSSGSATLTATGYSVDLGFTYDWQSSPAGANTWTSTGGVNPASYATGTISSSTDFRLFVTCATTSSMDSSNVVTVTINPPVTPSVSISANPGTTICTGTNVTFTATPTNGGSSPSYQWKKNGGNVGTNSPSYSDNTLLNGDQITCELTSNAACASPVTVVSNTLTFTVVSSITPTVSIVVSPGSTICPGSTATFTASPTNGGTVPVYQWKVNGNNVGTNSTSYSSSSLVTGDQVTCVLTSSDPCASPATVTSNTITMTVQDNTAPTAVCQNVSIVLNAGGTASTAAADVNNGSSDNCTAAASLTLSLSATSFSCGDIGSNSVTLTVTDGSGNTGTCSATVTVSDTTAPVITCPSNISVGNDLGVCGAIVSYTTPVGTDNCTPVTTQTAGMASGSTFPVGTTVNSFSVADGSSNSDSCSFTITVTDTESPAITCPADVTVAATSCSETATWTPPTASDNCSATEAGSHAPGSVFAVGTTAVTYTATDGAGNTSSCSFNVTVSVTALSASVTPNAATICSGASTTLTANPAGGIAPYSYMWSTGDTTGSITVAPTANTTYTVTITDACGTSVTATSSVTIETAPAAGFTWVDNGGGNVTFTNTSTGGISYAWDFGNGTTGTQGTPTFSITYAASGAYTVTLIVTNACGSDTIVQTVNVLIGILNQLPETATQVFPNPSSGQFTLLMSSMEGRLAQITVSDMRGVRVEGREVLVNAKEHKEGFDLGSYSKGVYFLRVTTEEGVAVHKITVQ